MQGEYLDSVSPIEKIRLIKEYNDVWAQSTGAPPIQKIKLIKRLNDIAVELEWVGSDIKAPETSAADYPNGEALVESIRKQLEELRPYSNNADACITDRITVVQKINTVTNDIYKNLDKFYKRGSKEWFEISEELSTDLDDIVYGIGDNAIFKGRLAINEKYDRKTNLEAFWEDEGKLKFTKSESFFASQAKLFDTPEFLKGQKLCQLTIRLLNGAYDVITGIQQNIGQEPKEPAPVEPEPVAEPEPTSTAAITAPYYEINEEAARNANRANSFSDYKAGSATAEYRSLVAEAAEIAANQKEKVDPSYHEKIDNLLDLYSRKLAANLNKRNEILARVPSVLISGPGNFPTRQKEKQNAALEKNMQEYEDIKGILSKIEGVGKGGISSDDPNAVSKLESKLKDLENLQEKMKQVNAYYRKHNTLEGCPLLSEEEKAQFKDWFDRGIVRGQPYMSYSLSNNNAEIRRLKQRIESLKKRKDGLFTGWEFEGGKVEANAEANRLQIHFEDKPSPELRSELKSNGFRWAPYSKVWQRQLNGNAIYAADRIEAIKPSTGESVIELQRRVHKEKQGQTEPKPAATEPTPTDPTPAEPTTTEPAEPPKDDQEFLQSIIDGKTDGNVDSNFRRLKILTAGVDNNPDSPLKPLVKDAIGVLIKQAMKAGAAKIAEMV